MAMASVSATENTHDPHRALRDDVRLLGELLGETLRRQEGQPLFERVERVRALAKRTRVSSADGFETLAGELRAMPVESALPIARSFAHFLNLANVAEQHHRVRRRRAYQRDPRARPQPASIEEALPRLLSGGVSPDALHRAVCSLGIELVVTAHPTEIMRRSLQHKYRRIADALADLDHGDVTLSRARDARRDDAARDHRGVGDRGGPARAPVAARRGPLGSGRVRRNALGRAPALLPLARPHAAPVHRPRDCRSTRRQSGSARGSAATATATRLSRPR